MKYAADGLLCLISNKDQNKFPMSTIGHMFLDIIKTVRTLQYDAVGLDLVAKGILLGSLVHKNGCFFDRNTMTEEHEKMVEDHLTWYKNILSESARIR